MTKLYLAMLPCLILSSNIFATAPYQQQVILNTSVAHMDNKVQFKVDCATCTKIAKQDEHNYFITFTAPADKPTTNYITFSYFYGDEKIFCKYNANVRFWLHQDGRFDCSLNQSTSLDSGSTSKACPKKVALFADTNQSVTNLFIDW